MYLQRSPLSPLQNQHATASHPQLRKSPLLSDTLPSLLVGAVPPAPVAAAEAAVPAAQLLPVAQADLPAGQLTINELVWRETPDDGYYVAWIPATRLADFCAGEQARGQCKLVRQGVYQYKQEAERQRSIRTDTKLFKAEFYCDHGPEDFRSAGRPAGGHPNNLDEKLAPCHPWRTLQHTTAAVALSAIGC